MGLNIITRGASKRRASRMAEFREADAAWRETRSSEHAKWRIEAQRSKDMTDADFADSIVEDAERDGDDLKRRKGLMKKYGLDVPQPEPEHEKE